jgi:signal peptidase II
MTSSVPDRGTAPPSGSERPSAAAAAGGWRSRIALLTVMVGAVIVVVDQLTKHWAQNALSDGREVHVLWTLQFNLSFNTGMAFSRGRGLGPFIGVAALVVVVVLVVSSSKVDNRLGRFSAGMLLGGAVGNLVDRVFRGDGWLHGAVIDFIDFQWFPIFNVADIGVTVGAVLFGLSTMLSARRQMPAPSTVSDTEVDPDDAVAP